LVRNLNTIIPATFPDISLYQLLAKIEQPLVLISANYDLFLERALQQVGRKYAVVSSIICGMQDCKIGDVLVRYSDRDQPELLRLEQDLSSLKPVESGYALIYKIRGYCDAANTPATYEHSMLTLTEENYFTFARHLDSLIPSYVVRQLTGRGLFFLGYSPRYWEDRLLVNAILDKRGPQQEPAQVFTRDEDQFVRAYWDSRRVHRYDIELSELVDRLKEHLS
jgi:hypothetical protein